MQDVQVLFHTHHFNNIWHSSEIFDLQLSIQILASFD
jgi:hypothetical protein